MSMLFYHHGPKCMGYSVGTLLTLLIQTNLVTIGSAAWFGPHLAKVPLPVIPVLPTGFLLKHKFGHRINFTIFKTQTCCNLNFLRFYLIPWYIVHYLIISLVTFSIYTRLFIPLYWRVRFFPTKNKTLQISSKVHVDWCCYIWKYIMQRDQLGDHLVKHER